MAGNPNGVWSYGWEANVGGEFHLLPFSDTILPEWSWALSRSSPPSVYFNAGSNTITAYDGQGVFPPQTVWMCPGTAGVEQNLGVIRFTAPSNQVYALSVAVVSFLSGSLASDTDFHVLKNGRELYGQNLPANGSGNYSNLVSLQVGQTVDFIIGRGLETQQAVSCLKIKAILQPSTNSLPATEAVSDLIATVRNSTIARSRQRPLLESLETALRLFRNGHDAAGAYRLDTFIRQVRVYLRNSELADPLLAAAQAIIGQVSILTSGPSVTALVQTVEQGRDLELRLDFHGRPAEHYQLQESSDLIDWQSMGAVPEIESGHYSYEEPFQPGGKFYRAVLVEER